MMVPGTRPFEIVAHRGVQTLEHPLRVLPENTLRAFQAAANENVAIETDVFTTRDGELAVHHNKTANALFQLPGEPKSITESTMSELKRAHFNPNAHHKAARRLLGDDAYVSSAQEQTANEGLQIPTLQEVMVCTPGNTRFKIELKGGRGIEEKVVRLIQEQGLYNRVSVIGFNPMKLRKVKKLDRRIHTGWDFTLHPVAVKSRQAQELLVQMAKQFFKVDTLHPDYPSTTESLVKLAHNAGLTVIPWVPGGTSREDEKRLIPEMIARGADGVITNAVDVAKAAAAQAGLRI